LAEQEVAMLVSMMCQLNRDASIRMVENGVHACTDITGYGLLGHALEMAEASGVTCNIMSTNVPILEGALDYASQGMLTGGGAANRRFVHGSIHVEPGMDEWMEHVLYDPQTSGGLLLAVPEHSTEKLLEILKPTYPHCTRIGSVAARGPMALVVS
jgi:selenide,water dikinase